MSEPMVPVASFMPIVERWALGFDTLESGLRALAANSDLKVEAWRGRIVRRWPTHVELDIADVDEFLVAADLTEVWHRDLADLSQSGEKVSNKVRLPGESTPRIKRLSKSARLNREQIHALHRLHIDGGISVRELCRRGWRTWGYANEKSALSSVLDLLRSYGLKPRDRIEASMLATTTHGKLRRAARDPEFRRQERIRRGEIRNVYCSAIKTRYGRGRGERCRRPALAGSDFCISHDPDRAEQRNAILARAREAAA